ncbi:MAG: hypothetical protein PF692_13230 [Kiritimatiellae bacterium]|jgi:hypothetical protein|nr:hypothetical protein [Kiritimatiellia bacterium]
MKKVIIFLNFILIASVCNSFSEEKNGEDVYLGTEIFEISSDLDPYELDVVETYNESVRLEKEITEMYKEIKAAKLSRIQRQNLRKSLKQTIVPLSERLSADEKLLRDKSANSTDVEKYQEELQKVMQENDVIVANAEEMLTDVMPEEIPQMEESVAEKLEELLEEMKQEEQQEETQEETQEEIQEPQDMDMQQQIQELEQKTQEKVEKTVDALEAALIEMKQAEIKVDKIIEEMKQEEEKEEQKEEVVEEKPEEEEKIEEVVEETIEEKEVVEEEKKKEEKIEELKENLQVAKVAVKEAIEAIEEEKETVEEKIEQAREALEKIEEILEDVQEIQEQLVEQQVEPPQEDVEEAEEKIEEAKEEMKMAAEMLLMLAKLEAMSEQQLSEEKQIAQQQVLGELAKADSGDYLDITEQMKGNNLKIQPQEVPLNQRPPDIKAYFNNVAGRKFVKEGGTPAVWFYVDSWYLLGPYDNQGRMNIQKVYPPESIIDLDANYLGKYNAKLQWIYDSFGSENKRPVITPKPGGSAEYIIYYGYTELFFEEEADLWLAVGSDDRSDLWINDLPVWHSSNKLKSWRIDEGFRKVHFKKGINKIVFRLENGWHAIDFSLLINVDANPPPKAK